MKWRLATRLGEAATPPRRSGPAHLSRGVAGPLCSPRLPLHATAPDVNLTADGGLGFSPQLRKFQPGIPAHSGTPWLLGMAADARRVIARGRAKAPFRAIRSVLTPPARPARQTITARARV
jgi:hypothetical protein